MEVEDPLWMQWSRQDVPLRVGISACLLGSTVRNDRSHCRNPFLVEQLGAFVQWVPRCPEFEIGLGVPRSPVRLVASEAGMRVVQQESGRDLTQDMERYSRTEAEALEELDGYVLKKGSATCGIERVLVHGAPGEHPRPLGTGTFARALRQRWPELPVEEEGRLNDPVLRANFVQRVFARNRWRALLAGPRSRGRLVAFHTAHKLLLRAHDELGYQELGQLVGNAGNQPHEELYRRYGALYHATLSKPPAVGRHVNVLQHALGYFRGILSPEERRALRLSLEDYRRGALPLVATVALLHFHVQKYGMEYLAKQLYLDPHPKELLVRRGA